MWNKLLLSYLLVTAFAQDDETPEEEEKIPELSWAQNGQTPVYWTSIDPKPDEYSLTGYYGGFGVVDLQMVYITSTLTGKSIRDGHFVILWFEIDNSEGARGSKEAFSCKM